MRTYQIPHHLEHSAKIALAGLLDTKDTALYREYMKSLGSLLASTFISELTTENKVLAISTAEDADYLLSGVLDELKKNTIESKLAIFWNNHHHLNTGKQSVAPILHKYVDIGYEDTDTIIIVK